MAVDSTAEKYKPPDGGYGWVVVGVAFTVFAIMTALLSSFSVMYLEYVEAFDSSVVVVGTVVSYQALAANFSGLLCSGLSKLFDIRLVAMSGSLISACFCFVASFSGNMAMLGITYTMFGIGVGITFMSVSSVVQQYFDKKRTMANGFVMAGFSLGNFVYPPLARLGLDTLGWRITLSLCACLLMQNVWLCTFLRPPIPIKKDSTQATENAPATSKCTLCSKCVDYLRALIDISFLKDPVFMLFMVSSFCLSVSFIGFTIHLVNKALSEGIQRYNAAFVASTAGIINAIWRPVFGFIATIPMIRKNKDLILSCLLLSFGISLGVLAAANTFTTVMLAICFVSLSVGSVSTLHLPTFADMIEPEKLPGAIGLLMAFVGMGQFCGPPLAGWAYDVTNNYDIAYYLLGGFSIVGSLANFLIIPVKRKRTNKGDSAEAGHETGQNLTGPKRTRHTTINSLVGSTLNVAL